MFSAIKTGLYFDFIVSNPPYISEIEMKGLDASVKDFEPSRALFGGKDGLDFYRALSKTGKTICKPEARMYCEIGYLQSDAVKSFFEENGWQNVRQFQDLAGRPRVVSAHL
jgi:release factor glutamine methyltransferase